MTPSNDDPLVTETTALLRDNAITPTNTTATTLAIHEEWKPTWYWPWKPSYWTAIILTFLYNLTSGTTGGLLTIFLRELFCERGIPRLFPIFGGSQNGSLIKSDDPNCDSAEYSIAIAKFVGIATTIAAIMVYVRVNNEANTLWIIVAVVIEGITGSAALLDTLIHAYCSDLTLPEERTVVFGRILAGSYAGLAIGSALGGIVAGKFGLSFLFAWVSPAMMLMVFVYTLLIPESLTAATLTKNREIQGQSTVILVDETEQPDPKQDKPSFKEYITSFINGFMPEKLPNRLAGKYSIPLLMLTCTIASLAITASNFIAPTYILYKFRWSEASMSLLYSIIGLSRLATMTFFLPYVRKLAPHSALTDPATSINYDLKLVTIGVFIESTTFFLYGATPIGEGFYLGGMISSFGTMYAPAARGILTQSVAPEQVGETLGNIVTLDVLV
ncbi:hypothetical protein BGZ46_004489, partial [Entomortierella lignicola]